MPSGKDQAETAQMDGYNRCKPRGPVAHAIHPDQQLRLFPGHSNARAARTISVKWILVAAVLLMIVPAWGFAAYVSWQYALAERQLIDDAGRSTAQSVSSAVDFRLTSIEAAMATLALSPALREGDLAAFYQDALAFAQTQRAVVALVSPSGEQILNTNAPFAQTLPAAAPEARFTEAIASRKTQFSKVVFGNVTRRWLVTITMPVIHQDSVSYALVVGLDTTLHLGEMLAGFDFPTSWTVAVLDDDDVVAARRPFVEHFIGQRAPPDIHGVKTAAETGYGRGRTLANEDVHVYYSRLKRAPWITLVGIPEADLDRIVRSALIPVLTIGLLLLLSSLLAAWSFGMRFTNQLISIARDASAFRRGQARGRIRRSYITELSELNTTLETASEDRNRYEERLKGLIADKNLLMQEAHHRVKNSLQLVRGVLSLQARATDQPDVKAALQAAAGRIMTVADVHQHLYQGHSTTDINVSRYLEDLAADLTSSLIPAEMDRRIIVKAADVVWPSEKATTLGLIITELITNAIKYGQGDVMISFNMTPDGQSQITVEDQGPGFPQGFNLEEASGLGSKLVTSLIRADEGSIMIDRSVAFGRVILTLGPTWRRQHKDALPGNGGS